MPRAVIIKLFRYTFIALFLAMSAYFARGADAKTIDEHIYLVPAGEVDHKVVEAIKESLPDFLPMAVRIEISPREQIPQSAYDPSRRQYNAEKVLDDISQRVGLDTRNESAVVIADVDLYSPELDFVFGVAEAPKVIAIVSVARLRNEFYGLKPNDSLFLERMVKEVVHELGHAWGLSHCTNPKCVMSFSNTLADTDKKRSTFCHDCEKKLLGRYGKALFKT